MAYDLDAFIADCRATLTSDPGPAGRRQVLQNLERLLKNRDFVAKYCGDDQPTGIKVLYEDPKLGFQVLSHIMGKARVSPPHDHGKSWAIYGQAAEYTVRRDNQGENPATIRMRMRRCWGDEGRA